MDEITHLGDFPERLAPVQVADDGSTIDAMGRGAMRVRVRAGGRDVDLVNCHLKSKLLSFPDGFRPKDEGQHALRRLRALPPHRRGGHGSCLRRRAARGPRPRARARRPRRPERRALGGHDPDAARPAGLGDRHRGLRRSRPGDDSRLWNLAPLIPEERRVSRRFRGRGELIDHLLVSGALVEAVEAVDTRAGEPPSITEDPGERRDEPGSDHLPVIARFRAV